MTLIIATPTYMIGDGITVCGDIIVSRNTKKIVRKGGCLIGFAGDSMFRDAFTRDYAESLSVVQNVQRVISLARKTKDKALEVLVANGKNVLVFNAYYFPENLYDTTDKAAIGSGSSLALALCQTRDTREAFFEAVFSILIGVGGEIQEEFLENKLNNKGENK